MTDISQSPSLPDPVQETTRIAGEARHQLGSFIKRVKGELQERTALVHDLSNRVDVLQAELVAEQQAHQATAAQLESFHQDYKNLSDAHKALCDEFTALLQTVDAACTGFESEDVLMAAALTYSEHGQDPGETPDFAPASIEALIEETVTSNSNARN